MLDQRQQICKCSVFAGLLCIEEKIQRNRIISNVVFEAC